MKTENTNIGNNPTLRIKNNEELIQKMKNVKLGANDRLISFDVESLFPSIPVDVTLKLLETTLRFNDIPELEIKEYIKLTKLCVDQTIFIYNKNIYAQTRGTAMGDCLSPFLSDLFMSHFELKIKREFSYFPDNWARFVDDIGTIFDISKCDPDDFLTQLNNVYPTIKFTMEMEHDNKLPFLDVLLIRQDDHIEFDIYRKPTNNMQSIHESSNHHPRHKIAGYQSAVHRLLTVPLNDENFLKEKQLLQSIAVSNGFDPSLIENLIRKQTRQKLLRETTSLLPFDKEKRRIFLPYDKNLTRGLENVFNRFNCNIIYTAANQLRNLLGNTKDKIMDPNQKSGIYEIKCTDCDSYYVGQSRRSIETRFKEHLAYFRSTRDSKSSVADHMLTTGHLQYSYELRLLKSIQNPQHLDAWESMFISQYKKRRKKLMNSDNGPIDSPLIRTNIFVT